MVKEGDLAPTFSLPSSGGGVVELEKLGGRRVVLFFYPKDGSPGCTRENCLVRDMLPEFEKHGAVVLGISRDSLTSHQRFSEKHRLTHILLSDVDGKVSRAYDALGLLGMSKRKTFVIDEKGVVVKVVDGMLPDKHVKEALKALESLSARSAAI
ncbi:MAG: peroxiredoxin [Candidatus Caldarchaeum sp.]|nr:peroxiredoxin [Candidatus Caldarchaeum sp.]MDW7977738.1 peroxiredoxin [Candidatus Caldarchaeum sp.]